MNSENLRHQSFTKLLGKQTARQAAVLLVLASILTKFIGFARETVTARAFGISAEYDLFLTVFMIPAAIFTIMNYTISYALTPFYHKLQLEQGEQLAGNYINRIAIGSVLISMLIATGIVLLSEQIVSAMVFPGTESEQQLAVQLLSILAWLLPLYIGVSILQTILQAEKYFLAPSIGPVLMNALIIIILLVFSRSGIFYLAYAWVAGLTVWFVWILLAYSSTRGKLRQQGGTVRGAPLLTILFATVFQVILVETWPQLYVVFDRITIRFFHMPVGSIAALGYASTIYAMVLSIFAISLGQAIFPFLSAHVAAGRKDELITLLSKGIRSIILATLPIVAILFMLSQQIITLVYQRGNFDASATATTADALRIYALGLPFDSIYVILVGYFYAVRDFRNLIIAGILSFITKVLFSFGMVWAWGYLGLAASTVLAAFVRTAFVGFQLKEHSTQIIYSLETRLLLRKAIVSILPGALVAFYLIEPVSTIMLSIMRSITLSSMVTVLIFSGMLSLSYVLMIAIVGVPEWTAFVMLTKKYFNPGLK